MLFSVLIPLTVTSEVSAQAANAPIESVQRAPWGIQTRGKADAVTRWNALGWSLDKIDDTLFVGGAFLEVTNGTTVIPQGYLAKFDANSGQFDASFNPTLEGAVYATEVSPDGALFVGGEMDNWNGESVGALVKINPETGDQWPGFDVQVYGGSGNVREIRLEDDGFLYVVGSFTTVGYGGTAHAVSNAVRLNPNTGAIDTSWIPQITGGTVQGVTRSKTKNVVYVSGKFTDVNGLGTVRSAGFVGLDDSAQVVLERPAETKNNNGAASLGGTCPDDRLSLAYCHQIMDVEVTQNGNIWITGIEHAVFQIRESDYQVLHSAITLRSQRCQDLTGAQRLLDDECVRGGGGDGQDLYVDGDDVYLMCHCFGTIFEYDDAAGVKIGVGNDPRTVPGTKIISGVVRFNDLTGKTDPNFSPWMSGTSGGWDTVVNGDGCIWTTGQFNTVGNPAIETVYAARDLVKLCQQGFTPLPGNISSPPSCTVTAVGDQATVTWESSIGATKYRIYRSIDGGNNYWRGAKLATESEFTDTLNSTGVHTFYVASVATGSRSDFTECSPPISQVQNLPEIQSCTAHREAGQVEIDWIANSDPDKFVIRRSVDNGNVFWRGVTPSSDRQFIDSDRDGDLRYFVETVIGDAREQTECSVTTETISTNTPASCEWNVVGTQVNLTWASTPGADRVIVQRYASDSGNWFWRGNAPADDLSFIDSYRSEITDYRVKARYLSGDSDYITCSQN